MDALSSKSTRGDIKLSLRNLPQGTQGLDTMYERAIQRIESQEEGFRSLAKQVLSWITHMGRPLTTAELQHALAIKPGMVELDEDFLPEIEDLVSICAGLVTADEEKGIIRWIHYTTQEYFERTWKIWIPQAQLDIASTCLNYLSFHDFAIGHCTTDERFEARLRLHKLFNYAAQNWGHHAYAVEMPDSKVIESAALKILTSEAMISATCQAIFAHRSYGGYSQLFPKNVTGIHLAAYFGLSDMIPMLINRGCDPDAKDSVGLTPLSWAARDGHETAVELLLATNRVDPDSKDRKLRTPLSWAAQNGHVAIVKLLIENYHADPDSKDKYNRTPLSWAAGKGHRAVAVLLLEKDSVDLNSRDMYGRAPLSWAARTGDQVIVDLLLTKNSIDPDSKDRNNRTPLSWAAGNGHGGIVKSFLARDAVDPDSKDEDGGTPLSWAAENGCESVVKVLLATGRVDPNSKDTNGETPLSWARINGHKEVIKLLEPDVDAIQNLGGEGRKEMTQVCSFQGT
jgi:ankyrin repeat protein